MLSIHQTQRSYLRKHIRQLRSELSCSQQQQAAQQVAQQALNLIKQRQAKHIALYLSFDAELNTAPLIQSLWTLPDIRIYVPILHPFCSGHLLFLQYQPQTPLVKNRFSILEPALNVQTLLPLEQIELLFTPLVAFDRQGQRLGMGGGFYDRTLANTPNLYAVGLAHACQQVDSVPIEPWDRPLQQILFA